MNYISTILVPFDFKPISLKALDYAVGFVGHEKDMRIILAYNEDISDSTVLDEDFKKIVAGYPNFHSSIEWIISKGTLNESLLDLYKKEKINLVIMGTKGNKEEDDRLTNTANFVHEADCPVLVVPSSVKEFKIRNIALVLGKEEIEDKKVLSNLLDVTRRFNAKVHVLTIENIPSTSGYSKIDEKNENTLEYYLEDFYSEHIFLENPDVVEGILNYAQNRDIDLISILPRNHAKKSTPSEGKLTQVLTLHSPIPILAID